MWENVCIVSEVEKKWMLSEFDIFSFHILWLKITETSSKHAFDLRNSLKKCDPMIHENYEMRWLHLWKMVDS